MGEPQELSINPIEAPRLELPEGYSYGVTRAADFVLQGAHPERFADLVSVLDSTRFTLDHLIEAGGNRSAMPKLWDGALAKLGWKKQVVSVKRVVDEVWLSSDKTHEIDMFGRGSDQREYPGIACEMEWNNKDPFFDRDLAAFSVLHIEGIINVGVIVTQGSRLHTLIKEVVPGTLRKDGESWNMKFSEATTHWNKLIPRVTRGGGGGCPLLLIGIEPERFDGAEQLAAWHGEYEKLRAKGDNAAIFDLRRRVVASRFAP